MQDIPELDHRRDTARPMDATRLFLSMNEEKKTLFTEKLDKLSDTVFLEFVMTPTWQDKERTNPCTDNR
jgi:hypothetical protein